MKLVDEDLKTYVDKRLKQNWKRLDRHVKNMKPIVMQEAVHFLMEKAATITKILTHNHHKMICSYLDFKKLNERHLKERELFL